MYRYVYVNVLHISDRTFVTGLGILVLAIVFFARGCAPPNPETPIPFI
jgi:hypothetical protein